MEAISRPARVLRRFWNEERGPATTEYALMLAVIVVAALVAAATLGESVRGVFVNEAWELPSGAAASF
jgi:Flp pilus assembly pilin Flp